MYELPARPVGITARGKARHASVRESGGEKRWNGSCLATAAPAVQLPQFEPVGTGRGSETRPRTGIPGGYRG